MGQVQFWACPFLLIEIIGFKMKVWITYAYKDKDFVEKVKVILNKAGF